MRIIDIHTHGIAGCDTKTRAREDVLRLAQWHGSHGVSAILPAIYPGPIDEMRENMAAVKRAMEEQGSGFRVPRQTRDRQGSGLEEQRPGVSGQGSGVDNPKLNTQDSTLSGSLPSRILGVHLEGPFLNPSQCGALDPASFLKPTQSNLDRLIEGFEDIVKIVTLAPELEGACTLIKAITDTGVIVSMGHSDATYEEAAAGFDAGAKGITHIFNAMRGFHHREPGIAGFGLMNKHVFVEVIADPYHLHQEVIKLIFTLKDPGKIIIISDSVKGAGLETNIPGSSLEVQSPGMQTPARLLRPGSPLATIRPVTGPRGKLQGGSMTIAESAKRLIEMGIREDAAMACISDNPSQYINSIRTT